MISNSPNTKSEQSKKAFQTLSWTPIVPESILNLIPYPPGKPIEETERELGLKGVIKLASNENPLGPSPLALRALQKALEKSHRYPDAPHQSLKKALSQNLSQTTKVDVGNIVLGCGSNELIDLIIRVFVRPGESILAPKFSFVAYKLCAALQSVSYLESEVDESFVPSLDSILKNLKENTRIVFLANPGNPTGSIMPQEEIKKLARALNERKVFLVLDYAYWEYTDKNLVPDGVEIAGEFPNVIVLKTFSKIYGLAGLRVGYSIASEGISKILNQSRQPFNLTSAALCAAEASLGDQAHVQKSVETNQSGKVFLEKEFKRLKIKYFPSQGNFFLLKLNESGSVIFDKLLKKGIIVRAVKNYGLDSYIRVSVGTEEENKKFIEKFSEVYP